MARCIHVQLRSHGQSQLNLVSFFQTGGGIIGFQRIPGVLPRRLIDMVESRSEAAGIHFMDDFPGMGHCEAGGCGVANQSKVPAADLIPIFSVYGIALRHVCLIRHNGIAAKVVLLPGLSGIANRQGIGKEGAIARGRGQIRNAVLLPGLVGHIAAHIEHGPIRPVTIESQHWNRMDRSLHTFRRRKLPGVEIPLHISASRVRFIQVGFLGLGQRQLNLDLHLAVRR